MGITANTIIKNNYKDSVFLMQISSELEKVEGVEAASLMMGTGQNKSILDSSGLLNDTGRDATENDLIIAIKADSSSVIEKVLAQLSEKFKSTDSTDTVLEVKPPTLESSLEIMPKANFALISIAGSYAAREAKTALNNNLNVMIFSDNVPIDEEVELKKLAAQKDLLLMGPDCGTAIINGTPLGFANRIPDGDIGIVAASGTGLQEVSVTIAKYGSGITQAFGTGGRDLTREVGGITMAAGIRYLQQDDNTKVIVLISKPPHPEIAKKIIFLAEQADKPVVICFLGASMQSEKNNVFFARTLEDTGIKAVSLSKNGKIQMTESSSSEYDKLLASTVKLIKPGQKYLRGLYTGGTLCDETIDVLSAHGVNPYSNVFSTGDYVLHDIMTSCKNTVIDLGDDTFTQGKPHPMIDPTYRNKRFLQESEDPEVAILLFDLVLGYGSHANPAGAAAGVIHKFQNKKIFIASICGTDLDPQNYSKQSRILESAGVVLFPTNAQAAKFCAQLIQKNEI